jgi:polyisoprenoid-binding protein YceI
MKQSLRVIALAVSALATTAGLAAAKPHTFTFDRSHSEVGFNIRHFFSKVHGRFEDYSGTLVFDDEKLTASSVQVTIRDTSIWTGNERRDNHLRTQDFFWQEKFPFVTFKSTKVVPGKDKEHFQVLGDLTIRDVTKPVTLDVDYMGMGPVAIGGNDMGNRVGFTATTTINRKDFGIIWNKALDTGGTLLGDDVEIVLNVEGMERPNP